MASAGAGDISSAAQSGIAPVLGSAPARESVWRAYVARIAAGEQGALTALYDESCRLIYGLAVRILGNAADAEEVALDVYTLVWKSAASFDPSRGSAAAWLTTITRSRAIDRVRSRAARHAKEEPFASDVMDRSPLPDESGAANQEARFVRAALASLPPEQREAVELAYFSGLSHSEVAHRLGQPLGTVKTRIRLGMMKLRETLAPLAGGTAARGDATPGAD
jgi:RNA polymerase sigma-70 factor (ECF subfamily)